MSDQTPGTTPDPSSSIPLTATTHPVEAVTVYPLGHHELMDPRDIASIEDWGPCG